MTDERPTVDSTPNDGDVNNVPREGKSTPRGKAVDSTENPKGSVDNTPSSVGDKMPSDTFPEA